MRRIIKYACFSFIVALAMCSSRATHLSGHTGEVGEVVFAPDARHFVSISPSDHTVRIWDGVAREQLAVLVQDEGHFPQVAFSPDSEKWALGGRKDTAITVRNTADGHEVCRLVGHTGEVRAVAFSSDGKTFASGSEDNTIRIWDLATTKEIRTIQRTDTYLGAVAFSPDGKFLAAGGLSGNLQLWDLQTGKEHCSMPERGLGVRLLFSPDSQTLCSVQRTQMRLWDVATGKNRYCEQPEWLDEDDQYIEALAFSPDGRTLAAGHTDAIGLWDVASGKNTSKFPKDDSHHLLRFSDRFLLRPDRPELDPDIKAAAFKPNGDLMVLGSKICTTTVVLWRLTSVQLRK